MISKFSSFITEEDTAVEQVMTIDKGLEVNLSDFYVFYVKVQNYHWNVEGPDFAQYHKFLNELYELVQEEIDGIAEQTRTLDIKVNGSLSNFLKNSSIADEQGQPNALTMLSNLEKDNQALLNNLYTSYDIAEKSRKLGISNFIQDLITSHEKYAWMLRSFQKDSQ